MSLISSYIKEILKGIKPSWRKLLTTQLKPELAKCLKKLDKDLFSKGITKELVDVNGIETYIRPIPSKIFQAFKYFEVSETKVIIIGQDPYTKIDEAEGLSFSVPVGTRVPPSLRNIFSALHSQKLIRDIPNHGHLVEWARQGILLLNRYLTRTPTIELDATETAYVKNNGGSSAKNMHSFWSQLTDAIVDHVTDINPECVVLLWGNKAQQVSESIGHKIASEQVDVQTWGHPSPLNSANRLGNAKSFKNCPHFMYVMNKFDINWNIKNIGSQNPMDRVVVFTDGGCTNNGKRNAKASYGVYFPKIFVDRKNPIIGEFSGIVPKYKLDKNQQLTEVKVTPTNNRGELLAIIIAFKHIIEEDIRSPILLVSDSEYCLNIVHSWIWSWVKKNKTFEHKKNSDLLRILYKQLLELEKIVPGKLIGVKNDLSHSGLAIYHQNSHLKKKDIPETGTVEYELWTGNENADGLCSALLD